ncbi:MAG: lipid-transfer protein [Actinobacteria bacterium]|nr:lipid-transfer protein [Actinomycetota bacterium]
MRDVAIVSFAQSHHRRAVEDLNEVEMLMPVTREALDNIGIGIGDIGFTCSGSTDYLAGNAFSFVSTLDGIGPWPPISESHVEMDGAWALYEAWVKLQTGAVDTAFVYSYSKSSSGDLAMVMSRQLDPYAVGPLWLDSVGCAALAASAALDAGVVTREAMAEVAARSRRDALANNEYAQLRFDRTAAAVLAEPDHVGLLHRSDCPPISDGAAAIVLAAGDRARELCDNPVWIRGIDHRIDPMALGYRDLTDVPSARLAASRAGVVPAEIDAWELHAPFSHDELLLRRAMGVPDDAVVNRSGGALAANPMLTAGLIRIGEASWQISSGESERMVAHATQGPALQQNLVAVLEGDR